VSGRAELHALRARLVARSDAQREEIAQEAVALRSVFVAADYVLGVAAFIRGRDFEPSLESGLWSSRSWPVRGVRWLLQRHWLWLWLRGFFGALG
jgi:hypothetical protein